MWVVCVGSRNKVEEETDERVKLHNVSTPLFLVHKLTTLIPSFTGVSGQG